MRIIKQLFFAILVMSVAACGKDNDDDYPVTYTYKDIAYGNTKLYYIDTDKNLQEVPVQGYFINFEPILKLFLPKNLRSEDNVISIKLLDDKYAELTYYDYSKESFSYVLDGQILTINGGIGNDTINLYLDNISSKEVLKSPLCVNLFSYKLHNIVSYSPYHMEQCSITDPKVLAQEVVTTYKLTTNDTVAISIPDIVFEKQ